jgi:predicted phosphoribosyltransferase
VAGTGEAGVAERARIVIALDTASRVAPVIETGAALAAGLDAMLDALFVEDEQLLRLAALPFAHELGFPSARLRRLDPADVERALRAQVEQVRRQLAATAAALDLEWQLNVVRGDVLRTAFGYADVADILVLGRSVSASVPEPEPAAQPKFPSLRRRPVLALFDGSAGGEQALKAAQATAGVAEGELVVLVPAGGPEPFRRLRERAAAVAAAHRPAPSQYVFIPDLAAGTIARITRAQRGAALFWPGDGRDPVLLAGMVEAVPCPVVVIG